MILDNIHPIFDQILTKSDKENLLKQRGKVLWLTGLSGSGKSTIAKGLEQVLHENGYLTMLLDGDNLRTGLNSNLGFSEEDRMENIRRVAEVAKLFLSCGIITISSFISPTLSIRKMAREIIGAEDFLEIYVSCPLEVAENRDVKGLYKKARNGEISEFTGISAPFEPPVEPALEIKTNEMPARDSVEKAFQFILPKIKLS